MAICPVVLFGAEGSLRGRDVEIALSPRKGYDSCIEAGDPKILKRHFTVGFFSLDLIAMCVEHGYWLPS
jgi:hypothetical protein